MVRASVAMAVYNGEKYINDQIDSILDMMSQEDELVISYDESSDSTLSIIQSYADKDARVRVVYDNGKSVESNFNNAVAHCQGKYIFFADQDDVWINDKINRMVSFFENNTKCVVLIADGYLTDSNLNISGELFRVCKTTTNPLRNYIKGTYLACQMAFDSKIKELVFPVRLDPNLSHDLWTGIFGSLYGEVNLLEEKLILHRMHDSNYSNTSKRKIIGIIKDRLWFAKEIVHRYFSNKKDKQYV